MPIRKGDLLIYILSNPARGSLAIAITDEYKGASCTGTERGVDIEWISVHAYLSHEHDVGYNVTCFEKIGHIDPRGEPCTERE